MFWAVRRSNMVSLPEIWTLFFPQITAKICSLVETQSVQSAPAGDKLTPYPADFIKWWNVRCRFLSLHTKHSLYDTCVVALLCV